VRLNEVDNNIGDSGLKHLSAALKTNNSIQTLNLSSWLNLITTSHNISTDNQLGDEGLKFLSEALKINYSIQVLILACGIILFPYYFLIFFKIGTKIGVSGIQYLSEALKVNNSICAFHLSGKIGEFSP
jgi:hypothetical protein